MSHSHTPRNESRPPVDDAYPYLDGSTGAWGYDFRGDGLVVRSAAGDLMGGLGPTWISDYHFTNAL